MHDVKLHEHMKHSILEAGNIALPASFFNYKVYKQSYNWFSKSSLEVRLIKTEKAKRATYWIGLADSRWPAELISDKDKILEELPARPSTVASKLHLSYNTVYTYLLRLKAEGLARKKDKIWLRT